MSSEQDLVHRGLFRNSVDFSGTPWTFQEHCGLFRNVVDFSGTAWTFQEHGGLFRNIVDLWSTSWTWGTSWTYKAHHGLVTANMIRNRTFSHLIIRCITGAFSITWFSAVVTCKSCSANDMKLSIQRFWNRTENCLSLIFPNSMHRSQVIGNRNVFGITGGIFQQRKTSLEHQGIWRRMAAGG